MLVGGDDDFGQLIDDGQLAGLEPLLGRETPLAAQAAVVRGHGVLPKALGQVQRHALAPGERIEAELAPQRVSLALLPGVSFLQRFRDTFGR